MLKFKLMFVIILLSIFNLAAEAKVFRNAYVSFEMPDAWKCALEQTEWVCRSENAKDAKEAIIILTAKEVGPTDSFDGYESHLNTPQTVSLKTGGNFTSKPIYKPKRVLINEQTWIDGLHLGSEIPNYFTRYLATIKDRIAILVTFTAHKDFYTKYSNDFFKAVMSLRVIATKNLLANNNIVPLRPGSETLGASIQNAMPADMTNAADLPGAGKKKSKKGLNKFMLLGIAGLLVLLAIILYVRNRDE